MYKTAKKTNKKKCETQRQTLVTNVLEVFRAIQNEEKALNNLIDGKA